MPQHYKGQIQQTHEYYHIEWGKPESLFYKNWNKTECPFLPLLFNVLLDVLARAIKQENEIKGKSPPKNSDLTF